MKRPSHLFWLVTLALVSASNLSLKIAGSYDFHKGQHEAKLKISPADAKFLQQVAWQAYQEGVSEAEKLRAPRR